MSNVQRRLTPVPTKSLDVLLRELANDNDLLLLFVDWVLSNAASRASSGKNPTSPLRAVWIEYGPDAQPSRRGKAGMRKGPARMRGSDLAARRYVAILALRQAGWSLKEASNHVAKRTCKDRQWFSVAESIKTGYEKYRPWSPVEWWITAFYDWLNCEIKENLFDRGISLCDLFKVMRIRLEAMWGDTPRTTAFLERYKEVAARAVIYLGRRRVPRT